MDEKMHGVGVYVLGNGGMGRGEMQSGRIFGRAQVAAGLGAVLVGNFKESMLKNNAHQHANGVVDSGSFNNPKPTVIVERTLPTGQKTKLAFDTDGNGLAGPLTTSRQVSQVKLLKGVIVVTTKMSYTVALMVTGVLIATRSALGAEPTEDMRTFARMFTSLEARDVKGYCTAMHSEQYAGYLGRVCQSAVQNRLKKPEECSLSTVTQISPVMVMQNSPPRWVN